METITVSPGEDRVLLLFDAAAPGNGHEKTAEYLRAHNLKPRREYTEERDGTDYLVYYFGHCYIESHLPKLTEMAT